MSDDTNTPVDPDMTPDEPGADSTTPPSAPEPPAPEWGEPTEPMEDPTLPDVPIDVVHRPKHSLADAHIGGTLGDPKNQ